MSKHRYTGFVIGEERNEGDTFFDRMLEGKTFDLTPTIGDDVLDDEHVLVRILQVHVHPRHPTVLIVFKTVEVNEERMRAGTYALIFREGLVCKNIPREPIDKNVSDLELLVGNIRACVEQFCKVA